MLLALVVLQWLHVFFGIFWFGSALFSDFILIPAMVKLPVPARLEFNRALRPAMVRLINVASSLTILLGVVRGLVGQIGTDGLRNPYGLTWLAAIVVGTVLISWEHGAITPALKRAEASQTAEEGEQALARLKGLVRLQLAMFLVIFSLMIAMRFGY